MAYEPDIPNENNLFSPIGIVAGDAPERSVETLLRIKNPGGGAATSNEAGRSARAPLVSQPESPAAHPGDFVGKSWGFLPPNPHPNVLKANGL
jgi:hypothetical protein